MGLLKYPFYLHQTLLFLYPLGLRRNIPAVQHILLAISAITYFLSAKRRPIEAGLYTIPVSELLVSCHIVVSSISASAKPSHLVRNTTGSCRPVT